MDPHTNKERDKIERINRRAARMVINDYGLLSSVIAMLTQLGWSSFRTASREPTSNHDVQSNTWTGGSTNYSTFLQTPVPGPIITSNFGGSTEIQHHTDTHSSMNIIPAWNLLPAMIVEATSGEVFKRRFP